MNQRRLSLAACIITLAGLSGCLEQEERETDPEEYFEGVPLRQTSGVDFLFVIDNSNSMAEEQEVLVEQFELMARRLVEAAGGRAPRDIRVGVVSTDMGTLGHTIQTCANPEVGDDGALSAVGRLEGCDERYSANDCSAGDCPWLASSSHAPDDGSLDAAPIWEDFACVASLGTGGCGFEQQLEAALVAAGEQTREGGANEGFIRDDSALVVVLVTDEDDCSTGNPELFDPSCDSYGPLCVRCMLNDELLFPLERYYNGLRSLRPGAEDLVIVSAIAGVPADGRDWTDDELITELRTLVAVDPANPSSALPSCETNMGNAYPPRRIAELVSMFEDNGVLGSICRNDWSDTFEQLTDVVDERLDARCVGDAEAKEPSDCRVIEILSDDRACIAVSNLSGDDRDLGVDVEGRRHCLVPSSTESGSGWRIDRVTTSCPNGELLLEGVHRVDAESALRLECLVDEAE